MRVLITHHFLNSSRSIPNQHNSIYVIFFLFLSLFYLPILKLQKKEHGYAKFGA